MEPNKFEKHIKNQLEGREIQPSSGAWEKLSERLDDEIPQVKKRNYFFYAVAASFIGLLIASIIYVYKTNETNTPIQVVESPVEVINENEGTKKGDLEIATDKVAEVAIDVEEPKTVTTIITKKMAKPDKLITQVEEDKNISNEIELPLKESDALINSKILEVVAQVDMLEEQNESLTDVEVDSLLRKAQDEIMNDKLFRHDRSVDAMALLSEVENELDKSFRDQIFESLKSGFMKVRTAVADRNN